MEDKKGKTMISETHLLYGVGLVFIYKLFEKFQIWWKAWIAIPVHQYELIGLGILSANLLAWFAVRKLAKIKSKNLKQGKILGNAKDAVYCGETYE